MVMVALPVCVNYQELADWAHSALLILEMR
jgi:hypothetical protein